jgi:hypothetical protein
VETHSAQPAEFVPVEALHSGDWITDVHDGGQRYTVLESKAVGESCVVLELESKANDQLRVVEKSFPAGQVAPPDSVTGAAQNAETR